MKPTRRQFLHSLAGASALPLFMSTTSKVEAYPTAIASNSYNWTTFYGRQQKNWGQDLDACMTDYAKTGLRAYEPGLNSVEDVIKLAPFLKKYNIRLPSVYVNSVLHQAEEAEKSIASVLAIADEVKKLGTKIMVTNPTPVRWAGEGIKTNEELKIQVISLEKLGAALRNKGVTLAYHTHDVELRAGAREFHHMLLNTSPQNVAFCLDAHWVYRGSQNSELAVFDIMKLYGSRIVELHIRQSVNGVWSETFGEGDIDYGRLARELKSLNLRPHLVIEQCVEAKSPDTMGAVEAHIQDLAAIKRIFKPILG